jgi:hypothetical protein
MFVFKAIPSIQLVFERLLAKNSNAMQRNAAVFYKGKKETERRY